MDWVHPTMVPDETWVDRSPFFSKEQKRMVREVLEFVAASGFAKKAEIQTAISEI